MLIIILFILGQPKDQIEMTSDNRVCRAMLLAVLGVSHAPIQLMQKYLSSNSRPEFAENRGGRRIELDRNYTLIKKDICSYGLTPAHYI